MTTNFAPSTTDRPREDAATQTAVTTGFDADDRLEVTPSDRAGDSPFAYRVKPESRALKTTVIVILVSLLITTTMFLVWIYNLLESIHITF